MDSGKKFLPGKFIFLVFLYKKPQTQPRFTTDLPSDFSITNIELQSTGDVVVSNNVSIYLLNSDGKTKATKTSPAEASHIFSIAVQFNDKILASMTMKDGTSKLVRYNTDGTKDINFTVHSDHTITAVRFSNNSIVKFIRQ